MMKKRFFALIAALLMVPGISAFAEITSVEQLNAPEVTIGINQGSMAEGIVQAELPQARIAYFTDNPSAYLAVAQGKVDAYAYDLNQMRMAMEQGVTGVRLLDETLGEPVRIAVGISPVSKIPDLAEKLNQFIGEMRANGTLDGMYRRWVIDGNDAMPEIVMQDRPSIHLTVGTSGIVPPYSYYAGTALTGYDVELAYRFAAWLGADVSFKVYDYGAIVPAAVSGDVDLIMADLNVTPERAEALPFSDILFEEKVGVMVKGAANGSAAIESNAPAYAAYNGKPLGVLTGTLMEGIADEHFPDSEKLYLNSYPDCIAALQAGKIDAFLADEFGIITVHAEQPSIDYIRDRITSQDQSFAFRRGDPASAALCEELNAFLARCRADGTLDEMLEIWLGIDEDKKVVDMSGLTGENGTIRVVTTSTDMPFSYIKDGKNVGYDIDLVTRFCRERGYALELGDVDFSGRIPAIQSGKYDFTTDMNVTPERQEEVLFSDATSSGGVVLAVKSTDVVKASAEAKAPVPEGLSMARMGIVTASTFEEPTLAYFPDSEYFYYNSNSDVLTALINRKIDGFLGDEPVVRMMCAENPDVTYWKELITRDDYAFGFGKSGQRPDQLRGQFNEMLAQIRADGTLDAMCDKWFGTDEAAKTVDLTGFSGENGLLNVVTENTNMPFSYVRDSRPAGLCIELTAMFCRRYGYTPVIESADISARIPGLVSGRYDMCASPMTVTEERKESISFSDPIYRGGIVLALRKDGAPNAGPSPADPVQAPSFWSGIRDSFNKTFIRESRWKLFAEGVGTTLLITVLSIIFGTVLGFAVFMLCRNGNPAANAVTRFCMWLVQGMPMVVFLMILYYVIFVGSLSLSGIAVAVIGFTMTFGSSVFGLLKMGVGAVDGGQYEAASALGYSNRQTFFKIILPQALPHVMAAYKSEIVSLIKATAIVGYIAVTDLTKMGDIVRSRTYEAFFPLIAITIIYFLLEGLLGFLVSRLSVNFNPKRRKPADILKGVKTDD